LLDEAVDELVGNAGRAEAADEDRGAVGDAGHGIGDRAGDLVDHESVSGVREKPKASASGVEHNVPGCSYIEHVFV